MMKKRLCKKCEKKFWPGSHQQEYCSECHKDAKLKLEVKNVNK